MLRDKHRWKNVGLWISLIASIPMILEFIGVSILPEKWGPTENLLQAIISLLVVLGVLNNPTTKSIGYTDDKEDPQNAN
ncbi:phage holin [Risungbinella massiliensis]|uniref:phage holin n=1 Tax=Risungbinella massiliensis TaxID=1329796 RepID=UPI0005CC3CEB|nr:phage holin [Risungbinella massiliensis]